jgi:N-sulfoglucosamine sulfohydrolase
MPLRLKMLVIAVLAVGHGISKAEDLPNILFAIADDWSFGHAGVYGCEWVDTPAFDRISREGLRFDRAYTPNAKCAPARSILLTGRNSWQLEDAGNHMCIFPAKFKSYVEVLAANGYSVGTTGKGWGPGIAKTADGRSRQMTGVPFNRHKSPAPIQGISSNDYAANFQDFLDSCSDEQPWCFWFGALEPHRHYQYGVELSKSEKALDNIPRVPAYWPDTDTIRTDMLDYAFEVQHFDNHLGRIITAIEAADQLDNTLIIVTSDHGMPFPRCKGQAYEHSNHIPMAAMWPNGISAPGRVVTDYVKFTDVASTIIEAAGLEWSDTGMAATSGKSLFDIFRSERSGQVTTYRNHVLIGKERHDIGRPEAGGYPIRGIVQDNWLYLRNYEPNRWPAGNPETGYLNCDGSPTKTVILNERRANPEDAPHWDLCFGKRPSEELYDLTTDSDCVRNLAGQPRHRNRLLQYRQQMEAELRQQKDPRMAGRGHVFDEYPYSSPATDHFYERFMSGEKVRAGWVNQSDFEAKPLD